MVTPPKSVVTHLNTLKTDTANELTSPFKYIAIPEAMKNSVATMIILFFILLSLIEYLYLVIVRGASPVFQGEAGIPLPV